MVSPGCSIFAPTNGKKSLNRAVLEAGTIVEEGKEVKDRTGKVICAPLNKQQIEQHLQSKYLRPFYGTDPELLVSPDQLTNKAPGQENNPPLQLSDPTDPQNAVRESAAIKTSGAIKTSNSQGTVADTNNVGQAMSPWMYDPDGLQSHSLDELNALVLSVDSDVEAFDDKEEAIAYLSKDRVEA